MELLAIFELPFMQRALMAGVALGFILPFFGVFVTLRRMSFFGDGIAHATLSGVAIAVVLELSPFPVALIIGALFGILIYVLEKKTNISSDALVGVLFTGALAFGIALMSRQQGYQPELISFMFGSILSIQSTDLTIILVFSLIIVASLIILYRGLTLISIDKESAWVLGVPTEVFDFLFYVLLSVTIVLGVKLLGIILVSALLIIPPTLSKMLASSFKSLIVLSIIAGEFFVVSGLFLSYFFDLPSGATIILVGVMSFLITALWRMFVK
ncbi:MAG: metal ABC transporter permease [Myxococcales bacterium]|nr:metal ABC transporter permease [Myxococcales bacterium]USN49914.1 MAG: metal ABC transporter permease [Myxococcales bacterium]